MLSRFLRLLASSALGLALATALISEGIYLSSQLGREVTIDEVRERSVSTSIADV